MNKIMKITVAVALLLLTLSSCNRQQKSVLRQGYFHTVEQGTAELKKLESMYKTRDEWETRKKMLRENIFKGMNLSPLPKRTPLNFILDLNVNMTGTPSGMSVLKAYQGFISVATSTVRQGIQHGIRAYSALMVISTVIRWEPGADSGPISRKGCATFARMGAVVFSYSMFGWAGDRPVSSIPLQ